MGQLGDHNFTNTTNPPQGSGAYLKANA